jgi:alkylhydroperoxidase family enzyme
MARIPYVDTEDLPEDKRWLVKSFSDDDEGSPKHDLPDDELYVHRIMANDTDLHEAFRAFGSQVWQGLSSHQREFVILATAVETGNRYEWQQHVRISLDEGIPESQIRAVSAGDLDELPPEYAALVEYVTDFVPGTVDEDAHAALSEHYDDTEILGIAMLAGLYLAFARFIDALDVGLEVDWVGWDLENL